MQHTRLPCPPLSPRVCSSSCPLNQWCTPTISSSATLFSFCLQSFPVSGTFPMNQFFTSGGQSTGASVLASVLPMNTQDRFPLGWTGWISLQFKGLSRVCSRTTVRKLQHCLLYGPTLTTVTLIFLSLFLLRRLSRWYFMYLALTVWWGWGINILKSLSPSTAHTLTKDAIKWINTVVSPLRWITLIKCVLQMVHASSMDYPCAHSSELLTDALRYFHLFPLDINN